MKSPLSFSLKTLAAASLICATAFAQAQAPSVQTESEKPAATASDGQKGEYQRGMHGKKHMHQAHRDAAMWVPGLGPVSKATVDLLALNEQQAALVKAAQDEQSALRSARRDAMKQVRAERARQLESGQFDPRAAIDAMGKNHEKMRADQAKVQEKWLAVWDSLNDQQRQKLSDTARERAEKHSRHMQKHAQRQAS